MYWKKLLWLITLSCNVGSIILRPECPWRAQKYNIAEESVQYWNLFLFPPPPVMLLFLLLSDQSGECRNWFCRCSFILHNWMARLLLDSHVVLGKEDTSLSSMLHDRRKNISLVQHQSKFFSQQILTQEWVLSLFKDMILILTPYLPCTQQVATSNTAPIFVFPWIHPFDCETPSFYWKSVFTTCHCMKLRKICSVFSHEILSILNNTQKHEWGTWLPHHNGSPRSFLKGFILFTYLRDGRVVEFKAVIQNYSMFTFDVTHMFGRN